MNSCSVIHFFLSSSHRASISRDPFYDMLATRKRRIANKKWWPSTCIAAMSVTSRVHICVGVTGLQSHLFFSGLEEKQQTQVGGFSNWNGLSLFPPEDCLHLNSRLMWWFYFIRHRLWTLICHLSETLWRRGRIFIKLDDNKWTKRTSFLEEQPRLESYCGCDDTALCWTQKELNPLYCTCGVRIWNLNIHPHHMALLSSRLTRLVGCLQSAKMPVNIFNMFTSHALWQLQTPTLFSSIQKLKKA